MAAQNNGGQRSQRQESGNDEGIKTSKGQRGQRQEADNDYNSNYHQENRKNGNGNP